MSPHKVAALSLAGFLTGAVLEAQARPKASELLRKVRSTYSSLQTFRDQGEIEAVHSFTGAIERHRFDLAMSAEGGYRFTLQALDDPGSPASVVWRDGAQVSVFDSKAGQPRSARSLLSEVVRSYGEGGLDALVVPAFLAGAADVLSAPTASAVEGPEPCGDEVPDPCWILALSREGGLTSRLWIDTATSLVRQAEVRLPAGSRRSRIRVLHQKPAMNPPLTAAELTFAGPPPPAEPESEMAVRAAQDPPGRPADDSRSGIRPEEMFQSEMTVAVAPVVVRVVSGNGKPMLGLKPGDFRVRAGRKEIPVLAVDWTSNAEMLPGEGGAVPDPTAAAPSAPSTALELLRRAGPPPGKWVLFFVQADLEPSRIKGHLALLPRVETLLSTLEPTDRLALVAFDSRLRLRLDWTGNREDLREALRRSIRTGGVFSLPGDGPQSSSLTRFFDADAAWDAANPERALELVAEALEPYPGEKVVVYVGWGLGRFTPEGIRYTPTFVRAAKKLNEARASVFVLDVTHVDYHSLAAGLKTMAYSTGGTYASTYTFPDQAIKSLAQAISGYYVLTLDVDDIPRNGELLKIELREKKGTVLVRPMAARAAPVRGGD